MPATQITIYNAAEMFASFWLTGTSSSAQGGGGFKDSKPIAYRKCWVLSCMGGRASRWWINFDNGLLYCKMNSESESEVWDKGYDI